MLHHLRRAACCRSPRRDSQGAFLKGRRLDLPARFYACIRALAISVLIGMKPVLTQGTTNRLSLDQRDRHTGCCQSAGKRQPDLSGADDRNVKLPGHSSANTSNAPAIAIASSIRAAGRSLPKAADSRARAAAPLNVPITAPPRPSAKPRSGEPRP